MGILHAEQGQYKVSAAGSVLAMGFGMNLHEVLHRQPGFVYTAVSISAGIFLGLALGPDLIQVDERHVFFCSAQERQLWRIVL